MKTELIVIADCSGSMGPMRKESEQGVRKLIGDQKEVPGEVRMTLVQFNTDIITPIAARPLEKVKPEDVVFNCNSLTALYDAVGITLDGVAERIKKEAWAELVIVAVLTDGAENASKIYTGEQVQAMVKHCEANGWKFIMMAAGIEVKAQSATVGMQNSALRSYGATGQGVSQAYADLSVDTRSLRSGQSIPQNR